MRRYDVYANMAHREGNSPPLFTCYEHVLGQSAQRIARYTGRELSLTRQLLNSCAAPRANGRVYIAAASASPARNDGLRGVLVERVETDADDCGGYLCGPTGCAGREAHEAAGMIHGLGSDR